MPYLIEQVNLNLNKEFEGLTEKLELVINKYEAIWVTLPRTSRLYTMDRYNQYINVRLPANLHLNTKRDSTAIIVLVKLYKTNEQDASLMPGLVHGNGTGTGRLML